MVFDGMMLMVIFILLRRLFESKFYNIVRRMKAKADRTKKPP